MAEKDLWNYGIIGAVILGALMLLGSFTSAPSAPASRLGAQPVKANVGTSCGCGGK